MRIFVPNIELSSARKAMLYYNITGDFIAKLVINEYHFIDIMDCNQLHLRIALVYITSGDHFFS